MRAAIATATALLASASLQLCLAPMAGAEDSVGSASQIAWVRSAASRFVTAELSGDGGEACAVLNAPLRATEHHRTCQQRWDARLSTLRRDRAARAGLRSDSHAVDSAAVVVRGYEATIALPAPLMNGASRFVWSENCWMLTR